MTYEIPGLIITLEAGGDLSANQYQIVTIASDGQVDVQTSAGGACLGVLQNKPSAAGQAASIMVSGVSKIVADVTIDEGDNIQSSTDGQAAVAVGADYVIGKALTPGAAGNLVSVLLQMPGAQNNA